MSVDPYMPSEPPYPYQLGESTFNLRESGKMFLLFFWLRRVILGYIVCLCHIDRTTGLYSFLVDAVH